MLLRLSWPIEAGLWPFSRHIYLGQSLVGQSREYIRVRLDGGNTVVPGDRVLFVLMCATWGEGLYR